MKQLFFVVMLCSVTAATAAEPSVDHFSSKYGNIDHPGYKILRTKPLLPADFDQQVFDELWKIWPKQYHSLAERASPEERRRLTFSRYGLHEAPENTGHTGPALGYVDDGMSGWVMNCFSCHGGTVAGTVIPGLPNTHFLLHTLVEDVRLTKLRLGKILTHLDLGSLHMPLGTTRGTTNSVIFGVALGSLRDVDMNVHLDNPRPEYLHHDMDAPPWWHYHKKKMLYADGFSPKNHRVLMQFMMIPRNGPETLKSWEPDFEVIQDYIQSLEAPEYPFAIDRDLAAIGEKVFSANCAECHGTYGDNEHYDQRIITIDEIGTDPLRWESLTSEYRAWLSKSWLSRYGEDPVIADTAGYVAPPLDGIWATAPYLHNGSVPTLWHMLHPDERPQVWSRTESGYDTEAVGLEITTFNEVPADVGKSSERRLYFDASKPGKSTAGHVYPNRLIEEERRAVLEYLKTL
ncbi:MAG: cytochrome c [Planctomycetota bacterium]|nr:cytochrome c [Planctomycetota bacterium]MDA1213049.1 cytochrome c [Planctomycetota bacterium]